MVIRMSSSSLLRQHLMLILAAYALYGSHVSTVAAPHGGGEGHVRVARDESHSHDAHSRPMRDAHVPLKQGDQQHHSEEQQQERQHEQQQEQQQQQDLRGSRVLRNPFTWGDGRTYPASLVTVYEGPAIQSVWMSVSTSPRASRRVEVPDWSHGFHRSPKEIAEARATAAAAAAAAAARASAARERVEVDFGGPLPSPGKWSPVYFTGYGSRHPMGPLLLACNKDASGNAFCEVLQHGSDLNDDLSLHRAWGMWGDNATGRAYVSILSGSLLSSNTETSGSSHLTCCELNSNAEGCVACTGLPASSYNPFDLEEKTEQAHEETRHDTPEQTPEDKPRPPKRWPYPQAFEPVTAQELFKLLPSLQSQLDGATDPTRLPCATGQPADPSLPTLGDIFRSRKDLSLFEAMVENTHIQQLIPCSLTFIAVTDENARDAQGQRPHPCLAAALERPENQREMIKLLGRATMLGKLESLPISSEVPVLFGSPANVTRWRQRTLWNDIELTGEKIVFDRGVIHLLSRNDISNLADRDMLRRMVYWSCLHHHLQENPGLTRFALIMVDNQRPLPIIGRPPGPRPEWVGRGNNGWFAPPAVPSATDGAKDTTEERPALPAPDTPQHATPTTDQKRKNPKDRNSETPQDAEKQNRDPTDEQEETTRDKSRQRRDSRDRHDEVDKGRRDPRDEHDETTKATGKETKDPRGRDEKTPRERKQPRSGNEERPEARRDPRRRDEETPKESPKERRDPRKRGEETPKETPKERREPRVTDEEAPKGSRGEARDSRDGSEETPKDRRDPVEGNKEDPQDARKGAQKSGETDEKMLKDTQEETRKERHEPLERPRERTGATEKPAKVRPGDTRGFEVREAEEADRPLDEEEKDRTD